MPLSQANQNTKDRIGKKLRTTGSTASVETVTKAWSVVGDYATNISSRSNNP